MKNIREDRFRFCALLFLLVKAVDGGLPFGILERGSHLERHHMSSSSRVEDPAHGALGGNVLVVPDEVDLGPGVAEESVDVLLAEVGGAAEPVGTEDADVELRGAAGEGGGEGVEEGGAVVPLEVVERGAAQLVLDDVEVAAVGPVVPEVDHGEGAAVVHEEEGVELEGPWRGRRC